MKRLLVSALLFVVYVAHPIEARPADHPKQTAASVPLAGGQGAGKEPTLEGLVTGKQSAASVGGEWEFTLKTADGNSYYFSCPDDVTLSYKINSIPVSQIKANNFFVRQESFRAKVRIPASKFQRVITKCKNQQCEGNCPSGIDFFSLEAGQK